MVVKEVGYFVVLQAHFSQEAFRDCQNRVLILLQRNLVHASSIISAALEIVLYRHGCLVLLFLLLLNVLVEWHLLLVFIQQFEAFCIFNTTVLFIIFILLWLFVLRIFILLVLFVLCGILAFFDTAWRQFSYGQYARSAGGIYFIYDHLVRLDKADMLLALIQCAFTLCYLYCVTFLKFQVVINFTLAYVSIVIYRENWN